MKVTGAGRRYTVDVVVDGRWTGRSRRGALVAQVADKTRVAQALAGELAALQKRDQSVLCHADV